MIKNTYKAMAIATGLALPLWIGTMPANAADLGGDCCADLEERVAELEATTARKGNRKVSLKLSGWVNNAVMFWDDGHESNTYVVSNGNASTRFRFTGSAGITSDVSAGYYIELEVRAPSLSFFVNQNNDNVAQGNLAIRQSNMHIKSKTLGKLTWGEQSSSIDDVNWKYMQGGLVFYEQSSFHYESRFLLRDAAGNLSTTTIGTFCSSVSAAGAIGDISCGDHNRRNSVRYDSPTIAGFSVAASWGEDDFWDVLLNYKGTLGDFKVSGAVAYAEDRDAPNTTQGRVESNQTFVTGGIMHTPSGLFVNGLWWQEEIDGTAIVVPDSDQWYVQAGIQQKWNSLGATKIWGSYTEVDDGFAGAAAKGAANITLDVGTGGNVVDSELTRWGVGIAQNIDAAAMQLYLLYRHSEIDVTTTNGAQNLEDFDAVIAGGVIKF